ncbi:hypothetical protein BH11PLA2_BH11PLA2_07670 [soil metagenome]
MASLPNAKRNEPLGSSRRESTLHRDKPGGVWVICFREVGRRHRSPTYETVVSQTPKFSVIPILTSPQREARGPVRTRLGEVLTRGEPSRFECGSRRDVESSQSLDSTAPLASRCGLVGFGKCLLPGGSPPSHRDKPGGSWAMCGGAESLKSDMSGSTTHLDLPNCDQACDTKT